MVRIGSKTRVFAQSERPIPAEMIIREIDDHAIDLSRELKMLC